jgi:hypothetical protein
MIVFLSFSLVSFLHTCQELNQEYRAVIIFARRKAVIKSSQNFLFITRQAAAIELVNKYKHILTDRTVGTRLNGFIFHFCVS